MAKFHGKVGYIEENVEIRPGVWDSVVTERPYFGDVIRNSRRIDDGTTINNDRTVGNSISIVADPYALNHFFAMEYIEWAGTLWTISNVDVQSTRLVLRLGGLYHGPTASAPDNS